jgi:hypothetical protein
MFWWKKVWRETEKRTETEKEHRTKTKDTLQ